MEKRSTLRTQIDWISIIVPLVGVVGLSVIFMIVPEQSGILLGAIRGYLGNEFGLYFGVIGLGIFATMYMAFSAMGISFWRCQNLNTLPTHGA